MNAGVVFGGGLEDQEASVVRDRRDGGDGRYPKAGFVWSTWAHARKRWSGLPSTPSPAAVLRRSRMHARSKRRQLEALAWATVADPERSGPRLSG